MIFINHFGSSQAAIDYHGHLSRGDYFGHDVDAPKIEGRLAERLGLEGREADRETFTALCNNEHPDTGEKLTKRTREDRRSMTDFTFDVSKSVTLASLVDPRVNDAVNDAVRESMQDIEKAAAVRVRKDGQNEDRPTGNMMWIMWPHETGRPLEDGTVDPQKHRHVTVLNATYDETEGEVKAIQLGDIVRDKGYYQAAFHARLGDKLSALGYGVERDGNSFKLSGISKDLTDRFSRRTAVIEKEAEEKGVVDPAKKRKLGRLTRNKKGNEIGTEELRQEWLGRMTPEERKSLRDARHESKNVKKQTAAGAVQYAMEHSFERVSTLSEMKLKAEALRYAVGSVKPEDIDRELAKQKDLIRVKKDGQEMVTTHTGLRAEIKMLDDVRDGRGQYGPLSENGTWHLPETLTAEQGGAASRILNSRDFVSGIRGGAGTGKTTTLQAIRDGIERGGKGKRVFAFAPSAQASHNVLRADGFKDAATLESLLQNKATQDKVRGQVILVDEAGMIGTKDMARLLKVAKEQKARVILAGDYKQHGSVKNGDAFRLLEKEGGMQFSELRKIHRQKDADYKKAVEQIEKGTRGGVQKGFDILDKRGDVLEISGEERHKALVTGYLQDVAAKKTALIVTPTHAEADRLTSELRNALREEGKLGKREHAYKVRKATNWTEAQRGDARNYEKGMVVEFYQNVGGKQVRERGKKTTVGGFTRGESAVVMGKEGGKVRLLKKDGTTVDLPDTVSRFQVYRIEDLKVAKGDRIRIKQNGNLPTESGNQKRVSNGDIGTVMGFTDDGAMKLSDGTILSGQYGHFSHGYVDTSYAAQGKTVDRVHIAAGSSSVLAVNAQSWYVSVSRAREKATIYLDDKKEMRDAITRTGERLSAIELVKGTRHERAQRKPPQIEIVRDRLVRYWRDRSEDRPKQVRERGYGR